MKSSYLKLLLEFNSLLIKIDAACGVSHNFNHLLGELNIFNRNIEDISNDILSYIHNVPDKREYFRLFYKHNNTKIISTRGKYTHVYYSKKLRHKLNKFINAYTLKQLYYISEDTDIFNLGFRCLGKLIDVSAEYADAYERHCLWENRAGLKVVTFDSGNGYCHLICTLDDYKNIIKVF